MLADKYHAALEELGLAAKSKKKWHRFYSLFLFIPSAVNKRLLQFTSFVNFTHAYHEYREYKSYLPVIYFPPTVYCPIQ